MKWIETWLHKIYIGLLSSNLYFDIKVLSSWADNVIATFNDVDLTSQQQQQQQIVT